MANREAPPVNGTARKDLRMAFTNDFSKKLAERVDIPGEVVIIPFAAEMRHWSFDLG